MTVTCQNCAKPFTARRDAKYCSPNCRQQAYRANHGDDGLHVQLSATIHVANMQATTAQQRADHAQQRADGAQQRADELQDEAREARRYARELTNA